jgi:hypothetical protein
MYLVSLDLDRHCGVITQPNLTPCLRSLTCKSHSLLAKSAVPGRTRPFEELFERAAMLKEGGKDATMQAGASKKRKLSSAEIVGAAEVTLPMKKVSASMNNQSTATSTLTLDASLRLENDPVFLARLRQGAYVPPGRPPPATCFHAFLLRLFCHGILPTTAHYRRLPSMTTAATLASSGHSQQSSSAPVAALNNLPNPSYPSNSTSTAVKLKVTKRTASASSAKSDSVAPLKSTASTRKDGKPPTSSSYATLPKSSLSNETFSSMPDLNLIL